MRDYGKVHSTFWSSDSVAELSDDGRMLALYLMTCSHSTIAGVFRLPDGYAIEDLGWSGERVRQGFLELFESGFAKRCESTKWVWVRKHLDWNKPENPNQWKAAKKIASLIPEKCDWKTDFTHNFLIMSGERSAQPNPSGTLSEGLHEPLQEPFRNQEQEQEQEQERSAEQNSPPVFELPTNKKTVSYPVTQRAIDQWVEDYPNVGVAQEIRKMRAWLDANHHKRKTKQGMSRFIVNWLSRQQDKPGAPGGAFAMTSIEDLAR